MPAAEAFVDTNVLLYLLSADSAKADRAEALVGGGARISVQVLNELTNVARRKLAMRWEEIDELAQAIRASCPVEPLTVETHDTGRRLAERYSLSVYDAMIVASALVANCTTLFSEDMQHGLLIDRTLRIRNPFLD
ncbi:PIN domain-containing protein [Ramlibacter sp. WS9]|uniref:PIN domain-containing protein n=1 Tax=Ramlibacter sp. WS9 TaxID=1882741 RepID=UPI001144BC21|nr:PIN domain-containing protein [Ramlibacter sp. WS9]ROZ79574.1 PIN domain-containing protein [Ramlibacter sp. WS9]